MRSVLLAIVALLLFPPLAYAPITVIPNGGPSGDLVSCNGCHVIGFRDLQGGVASQPNFDVGAGSADNPGNLVLNFDVGKDVLIYDGHQHIIARFGPAGIVFYRHPKIRR